MRFFQNINFFFKIISIAACHSLPAINICGFLRARDWAIIIIIEERHVSTTLSVDFGVLTRRSKWHKLSSMRT